MSFVYNDCVKCPFRTLTEHSNQCDVYKRTISPRGELPKPFDTCVHSEVFNKNMRAKLE